MYENSLSSSTGSWSYSQWNQTVDDYKIKLNQFQQDPNAPSDLPELCMNCQKIVEKALKKNANDVEAKKLINEKVITLLKTLKSTKKQLDQNTSKETISTLKETIRTIQLAKDRLEAEISQSKLPPSSTSSVPTTTTTTHSATFLTTTTTTTTLPKAKSPLRSTPLTHDIQEIHFSEDPNESNETFIIGLLDKQIPIDTITVSGITPLMYAVYIQDVDLVRQLLEAGADPNQMISNTPSHKSTLLTLAIQNNDEEMALLLLKSGAKIIESSNINSLVFSQLALIQALNNKMPNTSAFLLEKMLLDKKARTFLVRNFEECLAVAAGSGLLEITKKLLEINPTSTIPPSALGAAIKSQNSESVSFLLEQGADPDKMDQHYSPLEIAAREEDLECFNLLLKAGANPAVLFRPIGTRERTKTRCSVIDELKIIKSPIYNAILMCLLEKHEINIINHKEKFRISAVGHSSKLSGVVIVKPKKIWKLNRTLRAPLEGRTSAYWMNKMIKTTQLFSNAFPDLLSKIHCESICEILHLATQWEFTPDEVIVERIRDRKPTILPLGYQLHSVPLTLFPCFKSGLSLTLCDRRKILNKPPIRSYSINTQEFNEDLVNKFRKGAKYFQTEEFYKFFNKKLKKLEAYQSPFELLLQEKCPLEKQIVANCSWESIEGAIWSLFVFFKLSEKGLLEKIEENSDSSTLEEEINEAIIETNSLFYSWLAFNQLFHLERYIADAKLRIIRPPLTREKTIFTRKIYKPSKKLIMRSMNSIISNKEKSIDPRVTEQIDEFEKIVKRKYK